MKTTHYKIFLLFFSVVCAISLLSLVPKKRYAYNFQDPSLSVETRVNDLVSRLTLEEKVAQMLNSAPAVDRLDIPAYNWWNECLHGVARTPFKVTVYPQAIGMAATFDKNSLHTMADYTAEEGRAINNQSIKDGKRGIYLGLTYWTPNINIFRDPRWGRGQETYGEDPYLTGAMGKAFVTGLQGDDPKYLKAAACAKHYAIHSGPEPSRHVFNVDVSDYDLWDTYLPAFRNLVVNAKVAGVMCAYNAVKGQPCCGSDLLMTSILRNDWHFTGYVTSDCGAIDDFWERHKTSPDAESAASDAVLHGTDVECGNRTYKTLIAAVKDGKLPESQLDISLKRLFTIRFRLGMFDPPEMVKYAQIGNNVLESAEHKAHALKMARQSVVLLKNDSHTLPLSKSLKKIAVIGPNADNAKSVLGNYNGTPSELITALAGIKAKLGANTEVVYEQGTDYVGSPDVKPDFDAVANRVKDADAIIFVGGIAPQLEGEEMRVAKAGFSGGDRTSILLPQVQTDLLKALKKTGKPVVFVMMTGSAIAVPWEAENLPAIVNAWYGGQSAGTAIADVLFGDYNPAGRLPVTFYKSDDDLPKFDDYSMANRTYRYFKGKPLYGFGYGLSYTNFKYDNLTVPASISKNGKATVSVKITNTGKMDGEEVAELYLSHWNVKAPIRALKGFERLFLKAGESKVVKFELSAQDLSLIDDKGHVVTPVGKLKISIGGSQPDEQTEAKGKTISKTVTLI
ncbi:glycosyl hydrolase [Mucilaginibacter sp. PPCGB 2223]|uniref:glycoside hydrolase family 3 C-terminal domain-containing protein n=1 Tax=Mucilaginibacter sp. PPCGB 2223 TaxID=1886027 RepID=UPI0008258AA4|nr:glycoside hydrolase family 3 C-terminal domain-containing protein [Mucilaginibacter sp. PPCGB 2223]OCX54788.1 glycosyl hydrolase [Mucilaginibacter sp. PPCGB 2223]